jgi:4-hydroxysphinganine ceramide fatty acyl 2-hydroxylase
MENQKKEYLDPTASPRLFENPILDKLSRTHISIPIIILGGSAAGIAVYGFYHGLIGIFNFILFFLLGALVFSLMEYVMHRHLYHLAPTTEKRKKLQYTLHGVHHDHPNDKERLAMPPAASVTIAILLYLLFRWVLGPNVFGFAPGFFLGYSIYLFIHYSVHIFAPPKNFLKTLWVHHGIHHYKQPESTYGVSSPLWDYVFGTMPERKKHN